MKKRTAILLLVLVLVAMAAVSGFLLYRSNTGSRLLSRAQLALRANKPEKAHDLIARYIRSHPDDWNGYLVQSRAHGAQGRFTEAHHSLDQAAKIGAPAEAVEISRADLYIAEGQGSVASLEASELDHSVNCLAKALQVLERISPAKPSVAVDVLHRIGISHRAAARANGRLAAALHRRSLRSRANQHAPALLKRWDEVFADLGALKRDRLMTILRETLEFRDPVGVEAPLLREADEILTKLLAAPLDDEQFQQQAWVVAASIALLRGDLEPRVSQPASGDWLGRTDRYCLEALAADPDDWQAMHLRSLAAFRRAQASMVRAREAMLGVIAKDPSRSEVANLAVRLCLDSEDREGLAAARAALDPLSDDPVPAALMLLRHELRLAAEKAPPGPIYREQIAKTAESLDAVAKAHPGDVDVVLLQADVAVRRRQYDRASELIDKALRIDPRGPSAGFARLLQSSIGMAVKGAESVEAELTQLRADHPGAARVQYAYALAMVALGKTDLAAEAFRSLTKLGEGRPLVAGIPGPETDLNRAEIALRLSDAATAREICESTFGGSRAPGVFHARAWLLRTWAQWRAQPDYAPHLVQFVVQANETDYAADAAAAVDEVFAMGADAMRQAAAEAAGADGPSTRMSALLKRALQLLPAVHHCRLLLSDRAGAANVIEVLTSTSGLSGRDQTLLAGALAQMGETDIAERLLRDQIARHPRDATELVYARLIDLYLSRGETAKALAELDSMLAAAGTSDEALLRRASILALVDRRDEADAIVADLAPGAIAAGDVALLQQLASYYSRTSQAAKTVEILDRLARIRPPLPTDYIVGASALATAGRYNEAVAMYRRAIGLERDDMKIPAMYRDLAMLLDADQRRAEALAVLAELRDLPGSANQRKINLAESLFHEGSLMLRWGLFGQAADRFRRLAAGDQAGSAAGRLALGRALAGLGEVDQAKRVLLTIGPGAPQYLPAQLLRISLTSDLDDRLRVLGRLGSIDPTNEDVCVEQMLLLRQADRADEAIDRVVPAVR